MLETEIKNFYGADNHLYDVFNNKVFIEWYAEQMKQGYYPYLGIGGVKDLIDKLTNWYEMKYPDRYYDEEIGKKDSKFDKMTDLSLYLNTNQLRYRLNENELNTVDANYRYLGQHIVDNRLVSDCNIATINKVYPINIDEDGIVLSHDVNTLVPLIGKTNRELTLEQLINRIKFMQMQEYNDEIITADISDLEEMAHIHANDVELRKTVFYYTALKLLYSKNTNYQYGYERALAFIDEMNDYFNANISHKPIDNIMNQNYTDEVKPQNGIKTLLKKLRK